MNKNVKRQIAIISTLSLLVGLFCQLVPPKSVSASDAAVQVELQHISRPNEVETGIAEGLGELVVQRIDTEKTTLKAYSKFSIEERGWVWIDNTVNTTYPGNASSSTLYTNAALTKMITPNYRAHDELGERLYAYYLERGTYYLETELYSYFMGVDLPLKQAVYGYYLPSSQVLSVEVETKNDTAQLHCTSAQSMSEVIYYWVKDTSTVDVMNNNSNFSAFYKNKSLVSDIEVDSNGDYSVCAAPQSKEWENYPVDLHVTVEGIGGIHETASPLPSPDGQAYVWSGEITGWGGPNSYPSSANHSQGTGEGNFYYIDLTNLCFTRGYDCGLELMNPYSPAFQGAENEMAQFIKCMKNPRIKVILKNGGAASIWNWDTELSFPSGKEMTLPEGYLDTGYFALFGNDDVITKVEIYDVGQSGGQITTTPKPIETTTPKPLETSEPQPLETTTPQPSVEPTNPPGTNTDSQQGGQSSGTARVKKKRIIQRPARVKIKKLKTDGPGAAVVTWEKVKCNDGYQIQYSLKRNFSGKKTTTSYSKRSFILGKSRKTYYVRVRAVNWGWKSQSKYGYKYGKWSKVKKVRLK